MAHRIAALTAQLLPALLAATVVVALTAGIAGPELATQAPYATVADTAPAAVCSSDTDCAAWSLQHGETADPMVDGQGEPFCLPGAALYDTETPAVGDEGVVCTPSSQAASQPAEDSPAFQCQVDGNMQCGQGIDGGPILEPASDGGTGYVCPTGGQLGVNEVGVVVCTYGQST